MKIKYSPCKSNTDTIIVILDKNTIEIDGTEYSFTPDAIEFPDIADQTVGAILAAKRDESSELWLTILRKYTGDCRAWDTGGYHDY